jgi:hypothetical protein
MSNDEIKKKRFNYKKKWLKEEIAIKRMKIKFEKKNK